MLWQWRAPIKNVLGWSLLPILQKIDKVDSDSNILGESNMITEKIINYLKKMDIMPVKNVLSSPYNCDDNKQ